MPVDYKKYPPDWKMVRVPRILRRAENCCERCGVGNGELLWSVPLHTKNTEGRYSVRKIWVAAEQDMRRLRVNFTNAGKLKRVRVVLTIAHLDHDEENWDVLDERLMAMCQQCHTTYDAKEKQRRINAK